MVLPIDNVNSAGVYEELEGDGPEFLGLGDRRGDVDAVAQHPPVVEGLCRDSESVFANDARGVVGLRGVVHDENLREMTGTDIVQKAFLGCVIPRPHLGTSSRNIGITF